MVQAAFARLAPSHPHDSAFGRGEQHPIFHQPNTGHVLSRPHSKLGPTSFADAHMVPMGSTRGRAGATTLDRFARTYQDRVAPPPGPAAYSPHLPSQFDVAGRGRPSSSHTLARRAFAEEMRAQQRAKRPHTAPPGGHARAAPAAPRPARPRPRSAYRRGVRMEPTAAPSPTRYAPLPRPDVVNVAGAPALLASRHDVDVRNVLHASRAASPHSLPAPRTYGVPRAAVRPVTPELHRVASAPLRTDYAGRPPPARARVGVGRPQTAPVLLRMAQARAVAPLPLPPRATSAGPAPARTVGGSTLAHAWTHACTQSSGGSGAARAHARPSLAESPSVATAMLSRTSS